jgi:hypothetical protein
MCETHTTLPSYAIRYDDSLEYITEAIKPMHQKTKQHNVGRHVAKGIWTGHKMSPGQEMAVACSLVQLVQLDSWSSVGQVTQPWQLARVQVLSILCQSLTSLSPNLDPVFHKRHYACGHKANWHGQEVWILIWILLFRHALEWLDVGNERWWHRHMLLGISKCVSWPNECLMNYQLTPLWERIASLMEDQLGWNDWGPEMDGLMKSLLATG